METRDCIALRRSVRKYKSDEVEWDKLGEIILAGRDAPSSGNLQNWRFVIVQDQDKRNAIARSCMEQLWMAEAPVHVVVCGDTDKASWFYGVRGERLYTIQNCAAAIQNMLLAATDLGLGSCWVGAFDEETVKETLGIPANIRPHAVVTLGYAAEVPPDPPWKQELYTICFLESYGGRVRNVDHILGYHSEKVWRAKNALESGAKKATSSLAPIKSKGQELLNNVYSRVRKNK